jgi:recombination protein RecA
MNEKDKAIADAMKSINKRYGSRSIFEMDDNSTNIESISTGCYPLDYVFGCGGLPRGRIIEIFGAEAAGKSVMAMFIAAQAQKQKYKVVWIDAEFSFNKEFATALGVDTDKLLLSQPTTGAEGLDIVDKMASTHGVDIIILDSVASLVPKKELEGEIEDQSMALQARMMSKALRIITGNVSRTNTAVIFINQLREKLGVYWGPKEVTPGGKALKFYSSVRLEVKKGKNITGKNDEVIGNQIKVKAVKNKVGLPWREVELELIFRKGINLSSALLEAALLRGIVKKAGSTYSLTTGVEDERLAVGKDSTIKYIDENPLIYKKINEELITYDKQNRDIKSKKDSEEVEEEEAEGVSADEGESEVESGS